MISNARQSIQCAVTAQSGYCVCCFDLREAHKFLSQLVEHFDATGGVDLSYCIQPPISKYFTSGIIAVTCKGNSQEASQIRMVFQRYGTIKDCFTIPNTQDRTSIVEYFDSRCCLQAVEDANIRFTAQFNCMLVEHWQAVENMFQSACNQLNKDNSSQRPQDAHIDIEPNDSLLQFERGSTKISFNDSASLQSPRQEKYMAIPDMDHGPGKAMHDSISNIGQASCERTTLMIRNIPNKYTQKMLLDLIDQTCRGQYDFFYLPIDFKNLCNLGYAFVNFLTVEGAMQVYNAMHLKRWLKFNSKKVCEISYARVQGKRNLVQHFRNSKFPSTNPDYLPLIFDQIPEEQQQFGSCPRLVMQAIPIHQYQGFKDGGKPKRGGSSKSKPPPHRLHTPNTLFSFADL